MNSLNFKNYLELCRRLGIRYVSGNSSERTQAPPENETASELKPAVVSTISETVKVLEAPASTTLEVPKWLSASAGTDRAKRLIAFDASICQCQKCPLGKTRNHFVFGSGNPEARVLFVGEAPGADEDAQGLPFVGKAGQLLTKIIESTKAFKRQEVFIANVLKCRPPGNRTPQPEEVEQCRPYLEEQIKIIQPLLIMALGASAAQALLKTKDAVGKLRNRWHDYGGIPLRVTYHPAALLRFEGYKKDVWEDMKEFTAKYQEFAENKP
jgi:uracil-DNA glycosylase family 4